MLKLIAWLMGAYALYHLWMGIRRQGRGRVSSGSTPEEGSPSDRTQIVDAEFVDVEDGEDKEE